ncbi:TIGR02646 family protein [Arsenophonus sp. aPb]|uniref:retron Ec78 anti-phage system effector HNH endonuclease PtuB n=1 Tax=Arsenophonus sp. aPb TaxID=3041619 RepID=UPI00246859F4|nr:retron Ec78 anti-phage system effector HNH endonuclease PtuB [Arsenophonus sp. aPb]WGL99520.1 TIGR02646 family protein [Arsenophonus sp. aPb]
MRKLTRDHAPACLARLKLSGVEWKKVSREDKNEIWSGLNDMQDGFCAYCECRLSKRKHIEHFKKRERFPDLRFDWFNLFGSCGDTDQTGGWDNCGIYKDNRKAVGKFDIVQLIKPDQDDPEDFLFFSETGKVLPRPNLNEQEHKKASETIRVLNLNTTSLRNRRRIAIEAILPAVYELYEIEINENFTIKQWQQFQQCELDEVRKQEFQTALKHRFDYDKT